ncbi:hypothetical protein VNO77_13592 [Canavalia gladiata]|uniref:Uncharacterized protein n=1 Tax=Canavalia gladiata TaxID=3824 RepID=A0AAN9M2M7_CANGL
MVTLKPYTCRTQCPFPIPDHPLPFPISKININSSLPSRLSQSHPTPTILCARRRAWSQPPNRKMLQLASTIAFNLKILPEPLNSIAGEIARGDWSGVCPQLETLSGLVGGWRGKISWKGRRRRRRKQLTWFVFVLICVAGLWSWRIRELDLFLRALSFCLAGISLVRLWWGKKAIKESFLGFFFGIVLILSSRLRKEDVKFWVQKLATCSPVAQIAMSNKNRIRKRRILK